LFQRGDLAACAFLTLQRGRAVGVERLEAPVGELGFADDRLLFGTGLGQRRALAADVVADGGKLGFKVGGGRERGQRRFGLGTRAGGFIARRGQADAGLFQRRNAGSVAIGLALGRLVTVAGAVQITLTLTCGIARLCLGRSRRAQGGFGGLLELTGGLGLDT